MIRVAAIAAIVLTTGCDGDDSSDADGGGSSSTTAATSTTATTSTTTGGTSSAGSSTAGSSTSGDGSTGGGSLIEPYCACMLVNCHDLYHQVWGEDEVAARMACITEAEGVPENGAPTMMGNFIECRSAFCQAASGDETMCPSAIGMETCQ